MTERRFVQFLDGTITNVDIISGIGRDFDGTAFVGYINGGTLEISEDEVAHLSAQLIDEPLPLLPVQIRDEVVDADQV